MRIIGLSLGALAALVSSVAAAHVQVYPTRLTLSDGKRAGMLSIRNRGDKAENFRMVTTFFRMRSDGSLEQVTDPKDSERPLSKYLRFSPRQFPLGPQAEQVVRVLFAGPGDLPEGEYRCHLSVEPVAEEKTGGAGDGKGMKIVLEAKVAVAIPIVYQKGKPTFTSELQNLRIVSSPEGSPSAAVDVTWTGNMSPFGDFYALLTKGKSDPKEVGRLRGAAAYLSPRTVSVPLAVKKEELSGGTLRVEFRESEGEKVIQSTEAKIP